MAKPSVIDIDFYDESADWTKQSWDIPPYKSREFLTDFPDLDNFRSLPVFKHAVVKRLIVNDERVNDASKIVTEHLGER